jgi:integrase
MPRKKAEKSAAGISEAGIKSYLEPEEITRLSQAATNLRDRLLIRLLFRLGCRITEALGVAVENINFSQSTVTIQHLKTRLKLSCPGCGSLYQNLDKSSLVATFCIQYRQRTNLHEGYRQSSA